MDIPETRYARSGDVNVAYQVVGDGPFDLVYVPPFISNVELVWDVPWTGHGLRTLASFCRLIMFDKRGTGLSDRVTAAPSLEERMDDVRAVMDAAGSERAAVFGASEGAAMSVLFAATYPDRAFALVLASGWPRRTGAPGYPFPDTRETVLAAADRVEATWGAVESARAALPAIIGREPSDEEVRGWARFLRLSASPRAAGDLIRMSVDIDVRAVLPTITVPTLVINRDNEDPDNVLAARIMADAIPGAEHAELPGTAHAPFAADAEEYIATVRRFVTDAWEADQARGPEPQRVLATVLFTDLVGSTARAVELGPRWQDTLREHNQRVRRELARFRGREVDTAGDGFFASGFDGPARAIRCAVAIRDAVHELDLGIRVGVHTGECDVVDGKLAGLAVVVGARVAAQAEEGEVLVSGTVKDLVAGSGIEFDPRGVRELKGLGEWPVYAVTSV